MSRVFKSSQVVIDNNKFKLKIDNLPSSQLKTVQEKEHIEKEDNNLEDLIIKKTEEMNRLYEEKIKEAQEEANQIISEAYEKSKQIMEKSRQEGFLEGKSEGFEQGKLEAESIIQEALEIKRQTESNMRNLKESLEEDIIKLTISVVEKILNKKIEDEHETILNLIKVGLEKCAFTENLVLRVSEDDYDFAISYKDKILALSQNINEIVIKLDKSLRKGSCIIDTPAGSIDTSIQTQFNQVKEMFEQLLKSE